MQEHWANKINKSVTKKKCTEIWNVQTRRHRQGSVGKQNGTEPLCENQTVMLTTIGYKDVNWIHVALNWVWFWVIQKTKQLSGFDRLRESLSVSKQINRQGNELFTVLFFR